MSFDPPFVLEIYFPPVAGYLCLLGVEVDVVSLAVRGEAPDHPLRSLCLIHKPFLCSYFPLTEAMYLDTVL